MEESMKKPGNSSSSLAAELFGSKELPPKSSSTGIFASIFPPPSQVVGRSQLNEYWYKQSLGNQAWSPKQAISSEDARYSLPHKDHSSVVQGERAGPCHLSSSLYYGGQEVYSQSPSTHHASGSYPIVSLDDSRKMEEKMIQMEAMQTLPPEEIGGKVRCIIRTLCSLAMNSSSILKEFMRPWFLSLVNMYCPLNKLLTSTRRLQRDAS